MGEASGNTVSMGRWLSGAPNKSLNGCAGSPRPEMGQDLPPEHRHPFLKSNSHSVNCKNSIWLKTFFTESLLCALDRAKCQGRLQPYSILVLSGLRTGSEGAMDHENDPPAASGLPLLKVEARRGRRTARAQSRQLRGSELTVYSASSSPQASCTPHSPAWSGGPCTRGAPPPLASLTAQAPSRLLSSRAGASTYRNVSSRCWL